MHIEASFGQVCSAPAQAMVNFLEWKALGRYAWMIGGESAVSVDQFAGQNSKGIHTYKRH